MNRISAIYKIQSKSKPHRFYIGSSLNIIKRWNHHLNDLRNHCHHSPRLQNHYNKYGEDDLEFTIVLGCDKNDILENEQYFLDSFNPYFNIYKTTRYYSTEKQSLESNVKRSKSMSGKKWSLEARERFSKKLKGKRVISEDARKKISKTLTGRKGNPMPEEIKKRFSEERKGEKNPMFGKHSWNYGKKSMSIDMIEKLRIINTGRPAWNKGKKGVSEETRLKMVTAATGKKRPRTAEHQEKLSESRKQNNLLRKMQNVA